MRYFAWFLVALTGWAVYKINEPLYVPTTPMLAPPAQSTRPALSDINPIFEQAVRDGILRHATAADAKEWIDTITNKAWRGSSLSNQGLYLLRMPALERFGYVVLQPYVLSELSTHDAATYFFVPKGVPVPTGNQGYSVIFDYNTLQCKGLFCADQQR